MKFTEEVQVISLQIDGEPISWKRPAHKIVCGKVIVFDVQKKEKNAIKWQFYDQYRGLPIHGPILVDITFKMPIPDYVKPEDRQKMLNGQIFHDTKPDIDNLVKFILDCMSKQIFDDDCQIPFLYTRKEYSLMPATIIRVKSLSVNEKPNNLDEINNDIYQNNLSPINENYKRRSRRRKLHRNCSSGKRIDFNFAKGQEVVKQDP